jgi:hypothetical protein
MVAIAYKDRGVSPAPGARRTEGRSAMARIGWTFARAFRAAAAVLAVGLLAIVAWCALFGGPTGWTRLHQATLDGDAAEVARLCERGADVNDADRFGVTPLYVAVVQGDQAIVEVLLGHGADPNVRTRGGDAPRGYPGPCFSIRPSVAGRRGKLQRIVPGGHTPLGRAVTAGRVGIVRDLIQAGADVNMGTPLDVPVASPEGPPLVSPLGRAVRNGAPELVSLLAESGARPGPGEDAVWPHSMRQDAEPRPPHE